MIVLVTRHCSGDQMENEKGGARIFLVLFSVQFIVQMTIDSSKSNHTNVVRMADGRGVYR